MTSTEDPPVEQAPGPATDGSRPPRVSLAIVGVAVVVAFGTIKLARPLGQSFTSAGDIAFIELGVRQALHHGTALGVYSRFGWHHPGPALFYFLAPWYWLSGESSRSLFLAAWIINGGCALGAVWIVRARAGELTARVLAVVLFVFLVIAHFAHFMNSWNPTLLALPLLLLMVSVAAAYSGSAWSFVVALCTASYLVQAHLGTLPISIALLALATIGFWRSRRPVDDTAEEPRTRDSLRGPLIVAGCLLLLFWIGPFLQQVTNSNGNLTQIARFYRHPGAVAAPTTHPLGSAVDIVANHATVIPLGSPAGPSRDVTRVDRRRSVHRDRARRRVRRAPAGTVHRRARIDDTDRLRGRRARGNARRRAARRIPLLLDRDAPHPRDRRGRVAVDGSRPPRAVTPARVVRRRDRRCDASRRDLLPLDRPGSTHDVRQSAPRPCDRGEHRARPNAKRQPFTLHVGTPRVDQGALAVQLDKDGYRFHVEPTINLYKGNVTHKIGGPSYEIRDEGAAAPPGATERPVATIGRIVISVQP